MLVYRPRPPKLWKVGRQMGTQPMAKTAMAAWTHRQGRREPQGRAAAETAASLMPWKVSALCPPAHLGRVEPGWTGFRRTGMPWKVSALCPLYPFRPLRSGWGLPGPASGQ